MTTHAEAMAALQRAHLIFLQRDLSIQDQEDFANEVTILRDYMTPDPEEAVRCPSCGATFAHRAVVPFHEAIAALTEQMLAALDALKEKP